ESQIIIATGNLINFAEYNYITYNDNSVVENEGLLEPIRNVVDDISSVLGIGVNRTDDSNISDLSNYDSSDNIGTNFIQKDKKITRFKPINYSDNIPKTYFPKNNIILQDEKQTFPFRDTKILNYDDF